MENQQKKSRLGFFWATASASSDWASLSRPATDQTQIRRHKLFRGNTITTHHHHHHHHHHHRRIIESSNHRIIESSNHRNVESLNHWIVESLNRWTVESLNRWIAESLNRWIIESLNRWIVEPLNRWIVESLNRWTVESLNRWIVESLNRWIVESLNRWIVEPLNPWIVESLNRWIVESLNRWIVESLNHWIIESLNHYHLFFGVFTGMSSLALLCYGGSFASQRLPLWSNQPQSWSRGRTQKLNEGSTSSAGNSWKPQEKRRKEMPGTVKCMKSKVSKVKVAEICNSGFIWRCPMCTAEARTMTWPQKRGCFKWHEWLAVESMESMAWELHQWDVWRNGMEESYFPWTSMNIHEQHSHICHIYHISTAVVKRRKRRKYVDLWG